MPMYYLAWVKLALASKIMELYVSQRALRAQK